MLTTELRHKRCPGHIHFLPPVPHQRARSAVSLTLTWVTFLALYPSLHLWPPSCIHLHQVLGRGFLNWNTKASLRGSTDLQRHFKLYLVKQGQFQDQGTRVLVPALPMICCVLLDFTVYLWTSALSPTSGFSKLWPGDQIWSITFLCAIEFYWNTAMSIHLHIVHI